jgi:hypothetical protein
MGVLVGGESKLRSREDKGIGGDPVDDDMTKFHAQPRPINFVIYTSNLGYT